MLTANEAASQNVSQLADALAMQANTSGGSSDTDVKEFAVKPRGVPSSARVATTVTPVTKLPSAQRNSSGSIALSSGMAMTSFMKLPLVRLRFFGKV